MPKKYTPNEKEKYMCAKHKTYFKKKLMEWKQEIIENNTKSLYLSDSGSEISSPDIVDQAASQTEKNVEMRTLKRLIARPIATLSIEAQEKHEKNEKIFADI